MKRRDLFKAGMAAFAGTLMNKVTFGRELLTDDPSVPLMKRRYADGIDLSIIGFGGICELITRRLWVANCCSSGYR